MKNNFSRILQDVQLRVTFSVRFQCNMNETNVLLTRLKLLGLGGGSTTEHLKPKELNHTILFSEHKKKVRETGGKSNAQVQFLQSLIIDQSLFTFHFSAMILIFGRSLTLANSELKNIVVSLQKEWN